MATKTVGATGRNYATWALWASYVNALALSAPEVAEFYNDAEFSITSTVTIGGWTGGSGTNTVTMRPATGQGFRDNGSIQSTALRYNQSNGVATTSNVADAEVLLLTGRDIIIDGLQFKGTASGQGVIALQSASGAVTIQNCIVQGSSKSIYGLINWPEGSVTIQNCLVLLTSGQGEGIQDDGGVTITDCTVVATGGTTGTGLRSLQATSVVKNTAVAGFTANSSGTASSSSANNATDKASWAAGNMTTGAQVSLTMATEWENVTAGSEDFRLKSTSAKCKDNGATAGPSTDIAGTSRPQGGAYDIGCWELVAAASDTLFAQACF